MNMERVKNIIIVFLIILNTALLTLNATENARYSLSQERIDNISALLTHGNIELSTDILRDFQPMHSLYVSGGNYDYEVVAGTLLSGSPSARQTDETIYYESGQARLTFSPDNTFVYDNPGGLGAFSDFSEEAALSAMTELAGKLTPKSLKLALYSASESSGDYYVFDFRGQYGGYTLYSTYLRFIAGPEGVVYIKGAFFEPGDFARETQDICPADEALVTLTQQLDYRYGSIGITISAMELIYYVPEYSPSSSMTAAEPCYLFTANVNNVDVPIIISAYNNTVIR